MWPESAVVLGELKNKRTVKMATWLEERCYKTSRKIIVVTQGIHDRLIKRGIPEYKIVTIPNGSNVELFRYFPDFRKNIRKSLSLNDKFIAIYAGIHGIAQNLETIIEAARILHEDSTYHFLLIGEGPQKKELQALSDSYALSNITFLHEQPRDKIAHYISAADVALVPLRNVELFKGALPSKIFDSWACRLPIILSVDGEARKIVEIAQGGIFVPPENPMELANAIQYLKKSDDMRIEMGKNGREYTVKYYTRQALAEKLLEVLKGVSSEQLSS